jgi:sugar/nucleoside kinase (ribokinase family)
VSDPAFDVVCIGHAIVDVLAHASDELVDAFGIQKGTMGLVDVELSDKLYADMGPAIEMSGGSAANTAVGVALLGGRAAFIGTVRDDTLGQVFAHDIRAAGVTFSGVPAGNGLATGRCLVLVTPDAERTMATYLGIGDHIDVAEVDPALAGGAHLTYVEGYSVGIPESAGAVRRAIDQTRAAGGRVALTLSDPFWVQIHGDELRALTDEGLVDVLFANEDEALAFTGRERFDDAVGDLAARVPLVTVTRGAAGAVVAGDGPTVAVPAVRVAKVEDTTGAGDLYAAGFLFGLSRAADGETCARLGGLAAAEVISHLGARPQSDLAALARAEGLL